MHQRKVQIEPQAVERIFEIAKHGEPFNAGINLAEAEWLLILGRDGEAQAILDDLKRRASLQSGVWLADAIVAYRQAKWDRVKESAQRCLDVAEEPHLTQCRRFLQ